MAESARVKPSVGPSAARARGSYRWVMLGLTTFADLAMAALSEAIPALVPFIRADLGLSRTQVGLLTATPRLGQGTTALFGGIALDVLGARPCVAVGLTLLAVGLLAFAFAPSFLLGLAGLGLGGLGVGIAGAGTIVAIMRWFPARGRATAVGLKEAAVPLFGAGAALVLPATALQIGWRAAVVALGLLVALAALAILALHRDPPDPLSAPRATGLWWRVSSLIGRRDLWAINVLGIIMIIGRTIVVTYVVLFLVEALGVPVLIAASFLAVLQIGGIAGRIGWGVVSDQMFRGRRDVTAGLIGVIAAAGLGALSVLPPDPPAPLLAAVVFVIGLTVSGHNGVYNTMVPEIAGPGAAGTALGLNKTVVLCGAIVGTPIFGLIVDTTGRYQLAWQVAAAAVLAGTTLYWWLLSTAKSGGAGAAPAAPGS